MSTNKGLAMHKATKYKDCDRCGERFSYQVEADLCQFCRRRDAENRRYREKRLRTI